LKPVVFPWPWVRRVCSDAVVASYNVARSLQRATCICALLLQIMLYSVYEKIFCFLAVCCCLVVHVCICLPAYILTLSASLFFCWVHTVSTHRSAMFPSFSPLMIYVSCQNAAISAVFFIKKNTNSRHVAIDTTFCFFFFCCNVATWPLFIPSYFSMNFSFFF
jgi:hypothetical protein